MSKRTKHIFISDLHIGEPRAYKEDPQPPYPYNYFWLPKERMELLTDFLHNEILGSDDVKELIILGDLFDHWVCPAGYDPAEFDNIINMPPPDAKKNLVNALKEIASHDQIELHFSPGNHDLTIPKTLLKEQFPGIHLWYDSDYSYVGAYYRPELGLAGEHGNRYNLFCAPNPGEKDGHVLPIGFFLSRAGAEKKASQGKKPDFFDILHNFAEKLMENPGLIRDLFSAVANDCGLPDQSDIKMNKIDNFTQNPTVEKVADLYSDLIERWNEVKPEGLSALGAIANQLAGFRGAACKYYFLNDKARIAVMGHTHKALLLGLDKDNEYFHTNDNNGCQYIYANSGTWIQGHKATFVEVQPKGNRTFIRLMEYKSNRKKKRIKSRYIYN